MSISFFLDGSLLPFETVRLTGGALGGVAGLPAAAWYGEPSSAGIIIDDEFGQLDRDQIAGWHTFWVNESLCSKPRIFTGWIFGQEVSRGPYRTGTSRIWDCTIIDQNEVFSFEVFRSTAASIYASGQTDVDRIEQARASHAMAGTPIVDNGRFNSGNTVTLGGVNMVGKYPAELMLSTAGQSGKNFYAYWDDSAAEISLHYDLLGAGPAATISVSNVPGDYGDATDPTTTVFGPSLDARLSISPANQFTGLLFGYLGGRWVYARNQTLIDDLSPTAYSPITFLRDDVYQTDAVGLTSTANTLVQAYLATRAEQKDTLRFTVTVPAAKVNLAHAGDMLTVRFQHLPGYESPVAVPIIRRNVVPTPFQADMYDITFECSGEATSRGPGGGTGGETPAQSSCDVDDISLVQTKTAVPTEDTGTVSHITLDSAPTPGNLQIVITEYDDPVAPTNSLVPDGYTALTGILVSDSTVQKFQVQGWQRIAQTGDTTTLTQTKTGNSARRVTYLEFEGAGNLFETDTTEVTSDDVSPLVAGTVTPTAGSVTLLVSAIVPSLNVGDGWVPTAGGGATTAESYGTAGASPYIWTGYQLVAAATGSYAHQVTYTDGGILRGYCGIMLAFVCSGDDIPLPPHIVVPPRPPTGDIDGSNTDYTTDPYGDGSLVVLHDGIDQSDHIASQDAEAGTFTLDYAPSAGSEIRVGTQAR